MKARIMKTTAISILLCSALAVAVAGQSTPAYKQPPVGEARMAVYPEREQNTGEMLFPLVIDLKDVTWNGRPAVLGGYVVRVEFDPNKVMLATVDGGRDPYFAAKPIFTSPEIANQQGWMKVTYAQLNTAEPTGMVNVGQVRFVEREPGGASTVNVTLQSVSSAMQRDAKGNVMRKLAITIYREVEGAR